MRWIAFLQPLPEKLSGVLYKALLVAFVQTYVSDREEYRPYLEASYANYISQPPFAMHMVHDLSEPLSVEKN
jgi:predicted dienelactone hydrolase